MVIAGGGGGGRGAEGGELGVTFSSPFLRHPLSMFAPVNEIPRLRAQYAVHIADVASNCNEQKQRKENGKVNYLLSTRFSRISEYHFRVDFLRRTVAENVSKL